MSYMKRFLEDSMLGLDREVGESDADFLWRVIEVTQDLLDGAPVIPFHMDPEDVEGLPVVIDPKDGP